MNGFCYRLIGLSAKDVIENGRLSPTVLEELNLLAAFDGRMDLSKVAYQETREGIVLFAKPESWDDTKQRFVVASDMEWFRWGDYEVGRAAKYLFSPDDIIKSGVSREEYTITDNCDNTWHIPIVRSPIASRSRLEREAVFDQETQQCSWQVAASERELFDRVGRACDLMRDGAGDEEEDAKIEDPETWFIDLAINILQRNYRIDMGLLGALSEMGIQIVDPKRAPSIIYCAGDGKLVDDYQKKRMFEGSARLSPGVEVESTLRIPVGEKSTSPQSTPSEVT